MKNKYENYSNIHGKQLHLGLEVCTVLGRTDRTRMVFSTGRTYKWGAIFRTSGKAVLHKKEDEKHCEWVRADKIKTVFSNRRIFNNESYLVDNECKCANKLCLSFHYRFINKINFIIFIIIECSSQF